MKTCGLGEYKKRATALMLVTICSGTACSATGPARSDTLSELKAEDLVTLPLRDGTIGFDHLDRALQGHFSANNGMSATNRIDAQQPVTLHDGYVIRRYLRPDESRHLLMELSSEPCFSVKRVVELAQPDPARMDYYQRTGIYTATGRGISVGFSADGFKKECVTSLEIAELPQ